MDATNNLPYCKTAGTKKQSSGTWAGSESKPQDRFIVRPSIKIVPTTEKVEEKGAEAKKETTNKRPIGLAVMTGLAIALLCLSAYTIGATPVLKSLSTSIGGAWWISAIVIGLIIGKATGQMSGRTSALCGAYTALLAVTTCYTGDEIIGADISWMSFLAYGVAAIEGFYLGGNFSKA